MNENELLVIIITIQIICDIKLTPDQENELLEKFKLK